MDSARLDGRFSPPLWSVIITLVTGGNHIKTNGIFPAPDAAARTGVPTVPDGLGFGEIRRPGLQILGLARCSSKTGRRTSISQTRRKYRLAQAAKGTWMKVGTRSAETGLIRPGRYVQSVAIGDSPADGSGNSAQSHGLRTGHLPQRRQSVTLNCFEKKQCQN